MPNLMERELKTIYLSNMILGRIKNGKLQVQRFFKKDLLKLEGREVEIMPVESTRSSQANRYYWGIVIKLISEHTGFTPEEVHEVFKKKFLTYHKSYKGKVYKFTKSTTDLKISDFAGYVDKIIQYATSELGIIIPDAEIAYEEY